MSSIKAQAKKRTDELLSSMPTYTSAYKSRIDDVLKQIENREPFSYDFNADALYRQYLGGMKEEGKAAMLNAQAEAAANTGGFDNSYGAVSGQQAYSDALSNALYAAPDFEERALSRYNDQTDALYGSLDAYTKAEQREYEAYQKQLKSYYDELTYWSKLAKSGSGGKKVNLVQSV